MTMVDPEKWRQAYADHEKWVEDHPHILLGLKEEALSDSAWWRIKRNGGIIVAGVAAAESEKDQAPDTNEPSEHPDPEAAVTSEAEQQPVPLDMEPRRTIRSAVRLMLLQGGRTNTPPPPADHPLDPTA